MIGCCSRFKRDGQIGAQGGNGCGDLFDVVKIKGLTSATRKWLRHDNKVHTSRRGGNAKIKFQGFPHSTDGGDCVHLTSVGAFQFHFDDRSNRLRGVDLHG